MVLFGKVQPPQKGEQMMEAKGTKHNFLREKIEKTRKSEVFERKIQLML